MPGLLAGCGWPDRPDDGPAARATQPPAETETEPQPAAEDAPAEPDRPFARLDEVADRPDLSDASPAAAPPPAGDGARPAAGQTDGDVRSLRMEILLLREEIKDLRVENKRLRDETNQLRFTADQQKRQLRACSQAILERDDLRKELQALRKRLDGGRDANRAAP